MNQPSTSMPASRDELMARLASVIWAHVPDTRAAAEAVLGELDRLGIDLVPRGAIGRDHQRWITDR